MTDLSQLTGDMRAALIEALENGGLLPSVESWSIDLGLGFRDGDPSREYIPQIRITPAGRLLAQALKENGKVSQMFRTTNNEREEWRRRFGRVVMLLQAEDRANQDAGGDCIHCGQHNGHADDCEMQELLEHGVATQAYESAQGPEQWVAVEDILEEPSKPLAAECECCEGNGFQCDCCGHMGEPMPNGHVLLTGEKAGLIFEAATGQLHSGAELMRRLMHAEREARRLPEYVRGNTELRRREAKQLKENAELKSENAGQLAFEHKIRDEYEKLKAQLESAQAPERWVPVAECGELELGRYIVRRDGWGGECMASLSMHDGLRVWFADLPHLSTPTHIWCKADGTPIVVSVPGDAS